MIDLDRNSKKQLVEAKGKRTRESSIYRPNQKGDFKISRGRFSDFLSCPRCFYLDRVIGLKPPGTPGWSLNETTDFLLKKEFDDCRKKMIPHRLFSKFGLNHVIPFNHKDIDKWRNSLSAGLQVRYKNSNIILTGGIDDVWIDLNTKELIVVDYKSQAKGGYVEQKEYLEDPYHEGYKIQMDFYAYLLTNMGFKVKDTAYFLVCNAKRNKDGFYGQMEFDEYLIPYHWSMKWIDPKVNEMIDLMNQLRIPLPNKSCNNCAYSNQYAIANGTINKVQIDPVSNVENNKALTEAKEKIKVLEESLEKLNNEKKSQDRILDDPKLLAQHVSFFFRNEGPFPMKEYLNFKDNIDDKEIINTLNTSIQELRSRSESYAEILSDPQLLKEYYLQFFDLESINEDSKKEYEQLKEDYQKTKENLTEAVSLLQEMSKEHKSWEEILTKPDILSEYVSSFFGKDGPYPINDYQSKLNFENAKLIADQVNKIHQVKNELKKISNNNHHLNTNQSGSIESIKSLKNGNDLNKIAQSISVYIYSNSRKSFGSGVLVKKNNACYTVLTAAHVISNEENQEDILIRTQIDQVVHVAKKNTINLFGSLDLATLDFLSENSYSTAYVDSASNLKPGDDIWISGYSDILNTIHLLYPGKLMGINNKANNGLELFYNNPTRPGSSGAPILNPDGSLIGINVGHYIEPLEDTSVTSGIKYGIPIVYFTGEKKLVSQESHEILELINYGYQEFLNNNFQNALTIFDKVIKLDNNSFSAFFYRGKVKDKIKDQQGALSDYLVAIKLNPCLHNAYNNIGLIKFNSGDIEAALENYNLGLTYDPNNTIILTNRGFLKWDNLGDFKGALNDFNNALASDPKNSMCYALRGTLLLLPCFKNYKTALADLNQAIKLDSKNWKNYLTRSMIQDVLKDKKKKVDDIKQSKILLMDLPLSEPLSDIDKKLIKKYLLSEPLSDIDKKLIKKYLED